MRPLLTLALVGALCAPALADTVIPCEDGSTLVKRDGRRPDMVIHRTDEMDIAIPFRFVNGNGILWTPRTSLANRWCDENAAPCAMEAHGDYGVAYWYMLDSSRRVKCRLEE